MRQQGRVHARAGVYIEQCVAAGLRVPLLRTRPLALSFVSLIWLCALIWLMSVSFSCTFIIAFQKDLDSLVCSRVGSQVGMSAAG